MNFDLQSAIRFHEQGQLDDAAVIYEQIIAHAPRHALAWNLLGVVAHQKGKHQQAVDYIHKAIHHSPREPAFHSNLAEALRAMGLFEEAVRSCQTALQIEPNSPDASNNLGLAWQALGNFESAITAFQCAVERKSGFALAHCNLGNVLRQVGRLEESLNHYREAVRIDPNLAAAHSNLGQLLLERYQRQEALLHCREAVRLQPDFPEAQNNLGNVLREMGKFEESRQCYMEALRLNPSLALTCNNLGQVFQEQGRLDDAYNWYRSGLQLDPRSARIHCNLGSLFQEREQYRLAKEHYERAIELAPNFAEAHHCRGSIHQDQGDLHAALASYREALRLLPDYASAHCSVGTILQELGEFDLAVSSFREAQRCDPEHTGAYAQLATLLRKELPNVELAAIRHLVSNPNLSGNKRLALHFGLAHVEDALRNYTMAAEELRNANLLSLADRKQRGQAYDPVQHECLVKGIIETFTSSYFDRVKAFGSNSEKPVFIVGLPRSGTTLTEQILASHSKVHGAGELGLAGTTFHSLPVLVSRDVSPWECTSTLEASRIAEISQQYLDQLESLAPMALRIVDKMPDNYLYLGLIATLFPRAKIIHCRRDLRDIAVSCWMTNFRQIRWANDFEHIASRFREYRRLIEHWRRTLPVPILNVDYEETVSDVDAAARRIVDWCGLEWESACVAYHKQRRTIRTASFSQVRQPIYQSSVARWKHYETALAPLFQLLHDPQQA